MDDLVSRVHRTQDLWASRTCEETGGQLKQNKNIWTPFGE
jgi:hypothetical protein